MKYFYSKLTITVFLLIFGLSVFAQQFSYPENQNKDGLKISSSKSDLIEMEFSIHEFEITNRQLNGEVVNDIQYGLNLIPAEEGTPNLPFLGYNVLIPNGAQATLVVVSEEDEILENIDIAPASRIPFDSEPSVSDSKGPQYQLNAMFPENNLEIKQTEIRGMQFVQLAISPFQFNPITGEVLVKKNIKFEIRLDGSKGNYGEDRFRSPYWDPILSDLTFNANDIPEIDYSNRNHSSKNEGCEYLIIVPDQEDFQVWADTVRKFRTEQGIESKVMTISEIGGNNIQAIDNFFEDVYATWDPVPAAVLLMSDYGEGDEGITSISFSHPSDGTYITDNYYADVTGNALPDFVFARMTGNNYEELEILVNKFLSYERTPPVDPNFYNNPITALGWQTERWFQICTESIGGYMSNVLGKSPVRVNALYEGDPDVDPWSTANNTYQVLNFFGPSGLNYIPSTPSELGGWTGGTADDIVDAINSGSFILQHRDHGNYSGWGEPDFNTSDISQLNNIDKLTHVFTINCLTGQFNEGVNSFGEKFHKYADGGAVSVTAPTQVSYSFVNDALVWGIYDNMWPDFMPDYGGNQIPERDFRPAFGLASGKYFLSSTNWAPSSWKIITYRLFHHHGDAFGNIYTEVPMENEVAHEIGITSDVTSIEIEAISGSLVGLSADGEFLASGIVEDGSVILEIPQQIPGTLIKVVVTKQNYFRYENNILVVPMEGPYVMKTSYTLNDQNGNGTVDYNEEINVDISVKNIGLEDANNVVLNLVLSDEFVTITNGSYDLGTIEAGQEIEISDAFSFQTALETPDMHTFNFVFNATNGSLNWESDLNIVAYAPNLVHSTLYFEEIDGDGNGYLDPGETATAGFMSSNIGHLSFPAGQSVVTENSAYININAEPIDFEALNPEESITFQFEISAEASTPYASIVSVINHITAAPFEFENEMFFTVGLIAEDWESETTNSFPWLFNGSQDWFITDDYTAEGDFALKSGEIGDNESSILSIEYDVIGNHQISFYTQISSEDEHDFLHFYIDDELVQSWSGLLLFEEFTFPVSEGSHTFSWEYTKDEEGASGLDAAWLDYIIFPPGNTIIGVDENIDKNDLSINVYPNPTDNFLYVKSKSQENFEYDLYNSSGQVIQQGQISEFTKINIESYDSGIYLLKIKKENGEFQTHSIIKR